MCAPRWYSIRTLLLLYLLVASAAAPARAQLDPMDAIGGTLHYAVFPDTTQNTYDLRYPNRRYRDKCFLFIYSAVDNRVTVRGLGYERTWDSVAAGGFLVVDLMATEAAAPAPIDTARCRPSTVGVFRIESEAPVVVYQYMATTFGAEAWTAVPVEAWGTQYYAAAIPGEVGVDILPGGEYDYRTRPKMFSGVIAVVAAYNDTRITLIPSGAVNGPACRTTDVVLAAGEAYQIESYVDTLGVNGVTPQADFGGSRIFANKPVGVVTGNMRARVTHDTLGLGQNAFKNMLIEALAPSEVHGTEFVYLPTWDALRPTGAPGEDTARKRRAEFVRVYGTHSGGTSGQYIENGIWTSFADSISQGEFLEVRHVPDRPRVYRTDRPAQAFMHSSAVVMRNSHSAPEPPFPNYSYDAWGAYMVEMVPREQWTTFAPLFAPYHPSGLEHFLNLVTDSSHRNDVMLDDTTHFVFNRGVIPGTDLVWGTMYLQSGSEHHLVGRNGARFHGYVYGTLIKGGMEEFRPMWRGKISDGSSPTGRGESAGLTGSAMVYTAEYEEYLAIAYAYPLAADRSIPTLGDSLEIDTVETEPPAGCGLLTLRISSLNQNPVGLRSIRLDSARNARIRSMEPFPVSGATNVLVEVQPIDRREDASATVVIMDRAGKVTRLPYRYVPRRLEFDPSNTLDFGTMTASESKEMTVRVTNPLPLDLQVESVYLLHASPAFRILSPVRMPVVAPKDSQWFEVTVAAVPTLDNGRFADTLALETECADTFRLPVVVEVGSSGIREQVGAGARISLSVSPVPVPGRATVTFSIPREGQVQLSVCDAVGRSVTTLLDGWEVGGKWSVAYDPADRPAGIYFAVLEFGATRISVPFVIVR